MNVWKTIKGYFWWTYPRGSVHYDAMVTLILAFIFLAPLWVNFKDKPAVHAARTSVLVSQESDRELLCEIEASAIKGQDEASVREQVTEVLRPVIGEVTIDRYERGRGAAGNSVFRVWVHR